jgi:hypothetical protein
LQFEISTEKSAWETSPGKTGGGDLFDFSIAAQQRGRVSCIAEETEPSLDA